MKKLFALLNTETKQFVTRLEASDAGADLWINLPFNELFSDDEGELAIIVHEANKHGEWEVVPVNVTITITKK